MVTPFEVVFSRYDEDVSFLSGLPWPATFYNKGPEVVTPGPNVCQIGLPNVGMDSHSVLNHMASRYDTLAEVTLFLCGSWRKRAENVFSSLSTYAARPILPEVPIMAARFVVDDGWPGHVKHWGRWKEMLKEGEIDASPYTLGEWWDRVIGGPRPDRLIYAPGQNFSVHRDFVHRQPREWYQQLARYFERARYPEECHHLERSWLYILREGGRPDVDL